MIPLQARVAHRVGRDIALLFHDRGTRRGWVVSSTPRPHFTPGKDPVPILQGPFKPAPGPVWRVENLVPTGIRSRTVQTIVSRYTDWATRPTTYLYVRIKFIYPWNAVLIEVSLFVSCSVYCLVRDVLWNALSLSNRSSVVRSSQHDTRYTLQCVHARAFGTLCARKEGSAGSIWLW